MVLVEHPRLHIQLHMRSASIAAHLPLSLSPLLFLAPTFPALRTDTKWGDAAPYGLGW